MAATRGLLALAGAILMGCLTDSALATNRTWTGTVSANWSEPGNWNPAGVPQNADNLTFDQDSPNRTTVNDLANLTVGSLTFNNNYSYQVSGNALAFTNGAEGGLIVFSGGSSTITINCALIFADAYGIYVRPGAVFGSGNKVYVHINGPITVPSGQVQVRADSESDATGSWTSHLYLAGPLSGAGDIIVRAVDSGGGNGSIEFDNAASSPNFTGVLWLSNTDEYGNRGDHLDPVIFNQSAGVSVAAIVGVRNGDTALLQFVQSDQTGTTLDVESGGQFQFGGGNATFYGVIMRNYSGDALSSVIDTGNNLLGVNAGGIAVRCDNNGQTPVIKGRLNLNGLHNLDVHGIATVGLDIQATTGGYGFKKIGASTPILGGANTFSGQVEVDDGTLQVASASALGSSSCACVISGTGTLALDNVGTLPNNITASGTGAGGAGAILGASGSTTLSGSIQLNGGATLGVAATASLYVSGVISGNGPLTKDGPGSLELNGTSPNTYSGDTIDAAGLLYLDKTGSPPIAVPANLVIGPVPANAAATTFLLTANSIGGSAVTVNGNSLFDLNGRSQTLTTVNLNDGGSVETGSGTLILASGATVNVGSQKTGNLEGSHVSSSIQGALGLAPNAASIQFNVRPYAIFYPFDARPELDVPASISVNGFEDPNLAPTGIIKNGSGRMRLGGNGTFLGGSVVDAGTLQVDGTLAAAGFVTVNAGATLSGTGSVGRLDMNGASATLSPGHDVGILTCYNLDALGSGFSGVFNVVLSGTTPGTQYTQLISGPVNLSGLTLSGSLNYAPSPNDQFTIIAVNNGPFEKVSGTFNGVPEGGTAIVGTEKFRVTYHGGDGNDVVLTDVGPVTHPQLTIERAGPNVVRLLWPAVDGGFTLQAVTNLANPDWVSVAPAPVVEGTNYVVTNIFTQDQTFYRLLTP